MIRVVSVLLIVCAVDARAGTPCPPPEADAVTVAEVTDEADLVLADGRRVMLAGAEPAGDLAAYRAALEDLVRERPVRLAPSGVTRDRWGRTVAHVWRADGVWVERELIASGLALRAPGLPNRACALALDAAEPDAAAPPDVSNGRLGRVIRAEGRVSRLRKSGGRVYMKLEIADARRLTVTMRDADFAELSISETDEWTGRTLKVRGHLEWWGEPTVSVAVPWDIARGEDVIRP